MWHGLLSIGSLSRRRTFAFPRRLSPELCCSFAPHGSQRAQGRPGAGGTRNPCATEMHTGWITGVAGRPAFPARMVLTVSFVLSSGSVALLPPSPCGWLMHVPGRAAASPQGLTPEPRASGPHDFSVRGRPCLSIRGSMCVPPTINKTAVTAPCRSAPRMTQRSPVPVTACRAGATASTAPRPASRDDREAPLWQGRDQRSMPQIRNSGKWNIFARGG